MAPRLLVAFALGALVQLAGPAALRAEPATGDAAAVAPKSAAPSFVEWYLGHGGAETSTTGLRRESKYTVTQKAAERFLAAVRARHDDLRQRDLPRAGGANLNDTDYLDTGDALWDVLGYAARPPEGSISPKIRIRAYVERDAKGKEHKAAITKGYSFLEIKMPHPTIAGVALKPRVIINNKQLDLLLERDRLNDPRDRAALIATLKADARNDPEVVDRFVAVFDALHARHAGDSLKAWLTTRYVREAYMLPVKDQDGKTYDLQITLDREVAYRKPGGKRIGGYKDGWRAVEIKVPLELAALDDAALAARGLGDLVELRGLAHDLLEPARRGQIRGGKAGAFHLLDPAKREALRERDWDKPSERERAREVRLREAARRAEP